MQQLGLTASDVGSEETEIWEKKATTEKVVTPIDDAMSSDTVFDLLGLSASDVQSSGEAWESKTSV
jgi:hypothetical protein